MFCSSTCLHLHFLIFLSPSFLHFPTWTFLSLSDHFKRIWPPISYGVLCTCEYYVHCETFWLHMHPSVLLIVSLNFLFYSLHCWSMSLRMVESRGRIWIFSWVFFFFLHVLYSNGLNGLIRSDPLVHGSDRIGFQQ